MKSLELAREAVDCGLTRAFLRVRLSAWQVSRHPLLREVAAQEAGRERENTKSVSPSVLQSPGFFCGGFLEGDAAVFGCELCSGGS